MELELQGKVAVVTGASRGIGRAIALGLAVEGCRVAIGARGAEALEAGAEEVRAGGGRRWRCRATFPSRAAPSAWWRGRRKSWGASTC